MKRPVQDVTSPRLLRRYLLGWALGALLVVWLLLVTLAWTTAFHEARKFSDGQLVAVARLWLAAAPSSAPPQAIADAPELAHEYLQEVAVLAWDQGLLVTDTHGMAGGLQAASLPSQGFATVDFTAAGVTRAWRAYAVQGSPGARRVLVLMDMQQRHELGKDIAEHVAQPAVLVLPLVALLLWWAIRRGLRPLDHLSRDVAALDGLAGQRLDTAHRFREFSSTVTAINNLVDSLQTRARREREFASDVAHELRTPLAALSLQASAAQHDPTPERLAQLEATALRAGHILSQLLDLARAQRDGTGREAWKDVPLGEIASGLIASHAQEGFERGHELSLEQPDEPVVRHVQPMLLELALRNLIENALRHTPADTQVVVEVWQTALDAGISVSDDGQRADAPSFTQAQATSGLGLGLRLVQRIAEQLGATLQRDTGEAPMTTRFTLRWPR
ncbi:HAMP domain-containing sensor histidine kinase [Hydrogenophaga sp.]|uniref:sensor histidine kinase n=1 Tax=Hydrogenophaga sp. TaxID=1904254 RepID=UPI002731D9EB|nr:HAMP domain-containing sensor histidine kinase [Hydrogenophaga sp.]MDP2015683.1 HAMP domain-containing sensor histidine kinase [Hydrogenophaga sp.]MDP3164759.1 HAMP domain-containing sensor histidine kinase [Hydrogenophaga sp.]